MFFFLINLNKCSKLNKTQLYQITALFKKITNTII